MPQADTRQVEIDLMKRIHNLQKKLRRQRLKEVIDIVLEDEIAQPRALLDLTRR